MKGKDSWVILPDNPLSKDKTTLQTKKHWKKNLTESWA
jgi:hypothetical protein